MKMSGKYKAACYCRLSQDDANDGTSVSIETQIKVLTDYCSENHFEIYDFYCDDGFTGTNFNRPNFIRMMSAVDSGAVNLIIVKELSRFGREYVEVGNYPILLCKCYQSLPEKIVYANFFGHFLVICSGG